MEPNRNIFREYDIRAVYEEDLKGELPYYLGKSFGSAVKKDGGKSVCIGGDNRLTTPEMKDKMIKGISESGCNVADVGIVPTPVLYFAIHKYGFDAGAMVTASHNPPEFNGVKMVIGNKSLYGKDIQKLADLIEKNDFEKGHGEIRTMEADGDYADFMLKNFSFKNTLRVGIDTGNGTLGPLIVPLFKKLGIDVFPLYTDSDPSFPNHLPDPLVPENLKDLIKTVLDNKLDIGLGYDGDGDRLGVVDENGGILWGDQLLIIYAREILKKSPGASVIFDVKCSKSLEEEVKKAGGVPVMWKTGHSLIENKLHTEKAPLAGELSGHLYFADDYYGFDDAVYASLRLLRIMDRTGKKPSALLYGVKKYHATPEIRIELPDEKKFEAVENIKSHFTSKNLRISDIDGVKVFFTDGWALVRASNTQPALVVRMEAENAGSLEKIKKEFLATVDTFLV
ncbi:MAG: phosphomannomutase/phosphoglucomutase [Candidatus Omnitrophica bacterium]|nr:phosphomannomutase/phosphoglucomutase [Candidatus Omnitrophota bacterium]